jgi:hypothetical protein
MSTLRDFLVVLSAMVAVLLLIALTMIIRQEPRNGVQDGLLDRNYPRLARAF